MTRDYSYTSNSYNALMRCPASLGSKTNIAKPHLDRWIYLKDAIEEWLYNDALDETSINQALEQEQKKKVVPIVEQVRQAISDVAEEKDYTYIFNLSEEDGSTLIIMYAKDSEDVTSLVRKKLGL